MVTKINHPPRLVILGLDGGSLDFLENWANQGLLPHFHEFFQNGVAAHLTSIIPPITPAAWTSFMTGYNPGKHGLFDFMEPSGNSYEMRYTNALSRRADTIWQRLNAAGIRVGVYNVPMTFPPDQVLGFMISGMDTPAADSDFIYPRELRAELNRVFGGVDLESRHLGFMKNDVLRSRLIQEIKTHETRRTEIFLYLLEQHPVDVAMLVYRATDIVQHFFWHYQDPNHHWYPAVKGHPFGHSIQDIYRHLDHELGRLLEALPDTTQVIIMSDHGAGGTGGTVFYPNRFLAREGFLSLKSSKTRAERYFHRWFRGMDQWLRGRLSPEQKSWLAQHFPGVRHWWESAYTGYSRIDWARTRAFANEILALTPGIWINLKSRFPQGVVEPGTDYHSLLEDIKARLMALHWEGRPLIRRVYYRDEIYSGPYRDQAPDLILDWWEEASFVCKPSFASGLDGPIMERTPDFRPDLAEWSGTHRLNGVLLMKGAPFRRGTRLSNAHICDLTPTILYLLDLPVPEDSDGQILREAFDPDFLAAHPTQLKGKGQDFQPLKDGTYSEAEAEKIAAKLKEIGYLG